MPNANRVQTVYLNCGDPDAFNQDTLYAPGHLGTAFEKNDKSYQIVQADSGCTASTSVGIVAVNDLAFWKDKNSYLVTNDAPQAIGGSVSNAWRNQVAGVFRNAVTAGNYCAILQRADNVPVNAQAGGGVGQAVIAYSGSDADITHEGVGTMATYQVLGIAREATAATTAGMCYVDLAIPPIP